MGNPLAQSAVRNHPGYSEFQSPNYPGKPWGRILFPSTQAAIEFCLTHCNTRNEPWGTDSAWIGLQKQTLADFHKTHIAEYALSLMQKALAGMPQIPQKAGRVSPTVTGASWDIPAVLAGLPLAARSRTRTRLPPKEIRLSFFMSAGVNSESMAPLTAKIAKAIWDYTVAGGAVSLHVAYCGLVRSSPEQGLAVETRVNTSDSASLAAALSPVFFRGVTGRIMSGFSHYSSDSIPCPYKPPLPGYLWIGGPLEEAVKAAKAVIEELSIV